MLDFLIVLGRIPGTNFYLTFNQIFFVFLVLSARYEYNLHERWIKWLWYRTGVNYRRRKRQLKTFIKTKRYRLAVWERRQIRNAKNYIRRQKRAAIHSMVMARNRAIRKVLRTRRAAILAIYLFLRRLKRKTRLAIKRRQRAVYSANHRQISAIKRRYYSRVIKMQRMERRLKRRLAFAGWDN